MTANACVLCTTSQFPVCTLAVLTCWVVYILSKDAHVYSQEGVTHIGPQDQFEEPQIGIINSFGLLFSSSTRKYSISNSLIRLFFDTCTLQERKTSKPFTSIIITE